ncbi:MAG TPA: phosphate signaling complex protein PhoU [Pseudolabrys sp.]|nr:phosphate signaling complex protein PhoU [Pseudolabrys sp.]
MMAQHTTTAFDSDLRELGDAIVDIGVRAQKQIIDAFHALQKGDGALARSVKAADVTIDSLQQELEMKAIGTIARRQPLAVDLREIVGALRIATDLERIGDLATNIAKRAEQLGNEKWPDEITVALRAMIERVLKQMREVIDSYDHRDLTKALDVWKSDEEVDALHDSIFRHLLTYMMEDPGNISLGMHLLFCAKNIERIGDHTTNIAEIVHYIVQGGVIPGERPKTSGLPAGSPQSFH